MASRPIVGPTMPPGYLQASRASDEDDDEIGPALPPPPGDGAVAGHEDGMSYAERTFLEREQRQKQAEADAKAAQEAANNSRPDWMLAPPPSSSLSSLLQPNGGPLKARGFSQNTRVQKGNSAVGASQGGDEGMALWTETPEQRVQRMKNEVMGSGPATPRDLEEEREKRVAEVRDAELQEKVRKLDGQAERTKSLLELHQEERRKEFLDKKGKGRSTGEGSSSDRKGLRRLEALDGSDDEDLPRRRRDTSDEESQRSSSRRNGDSRRKDYNADSRRKRDRRVADEEDSDEEDRRRRRERRRRKEEDRERGREGKGEESRRRTSRSPERRHSHRSRHDGDKDEHRRHRDCSRERHRDRDRKSSSHRRRRHRSSSSSLSRSPSPDARRRDKEKKAQHKAEKEKETGKGGASTMIWDRDRAMSFIPTMDEKKKAKLLNDARGLGDRFGSSGSGSKFL
ncbi:hypothetical protein BCV69DRAFT_311144 [Microstroma glucosiphilum]|uniref:DUF3752 domain-containing protein n=1 Tax=Pseudomicrostroma glucosiphilum TaxID=1684307 RepID=A0A316UD86_9BASI|nr:hypothetical protein BCV69DRAFT_311144 [Pseudomicrostroma glucosiphilum]PWN22333.1 hypothetical protein BCV69DRAFT_311144 [Pseudomicrostroma glucosiphilum]